MAGENQDRGFGDQPVDQRQHRMLAVDRSRQDDPRNPARPSRAERLSRGPCACNHAPGRRPTTRTEVPGGQRRPQTKAVAHSSAGGSRSTSVSESASRFASSLTAGRSGRRLGPFCFEARSDPRDRRRQRLETAGAPATQRASTISSTARSSAGSRASARRQRPPRGRRVGAYRSCR